MKAIIRNSLFINDTEPYLIEDDLSNFEYVFVPIDSYEGYKDLNQSIDKLQPYNFRSISVGDQDIYDAFTLIATKETNAPFLNVMFQHNLCADENYMTLAEAKAVTNEQIDIYTEEVKTGLFMDNLEIQSLNELQYFEQITAIPYYFCYGADNLEEIHLPKNCTKIEKYGLRSKTVGKLKYIRGADNIEYIGISALNNQNNLVYINLTQKCKEIDNSALYRNTNAPVAPCSYGDLSGIITLHNNVFYADTAVSILNFPNCSTFGKWCFGQPSTGANAKLYTVNFDWQNVTTIPENAFRYCVNLDMYLPAMPKLQTIDSYAFRYCRKLKGTVDYPNLTSIGLIAFSGTKIDKVVLHEGVTLAEGNDVDTGVFAYCKQLKYIKFPDDMEEIPKSVCYNTPSLRTVILPSNLKVIKQFAFQIAGIEEIELPDGLTQILGAAFGASNLKKITIPSSVSRIGDFAFRQCVNLNEFICLPTTPPTLDVDVFLDSPNVVIYVPSASVEAYKTAWSEYTDKIQAIVE